MHICDQLPALTVFQCFLYLQVREGTHRTTVHQEQRCSHQSTLLSVSGASSVSHPLTSLGNYTNWLKIYKISFPQKKKSCFIYNKTHLSFFSPVFLHFPFFSLGQGKLPGPKGTKVGPELSAPHQGGAERVKQKNRGQRQAATHLP